MTYRAAGPIVQVLKRTNHTNGVRKMLKTFQVGHTYWDRSACDHECIYRFTILARTAKTVTINVHGKIVRRGLSPDWKGTAETFSPFGRYSMSAVISADREEVAA